MREEPRASSPLIHFVLPAQSAIRARRDSCGSASAAGSFAAIDQEDGALAVAAPVTMFLVYCCARRICDDDCAW